MTCLFSYVINLKDFDTYNLSKIIQICLLFRRSRYRHTDHSLVDYYVTLDDTEAGIGNYSYGKR
jgi:hypothetical protein